MTRVRVPCSAFSSRTARMSRMAGSPRLMTAMRSNTPSAFLWVDSVPDGGRARCLHVHAAVDAPDLTGDVGRRVSGEEVDDAGDLLRLSQPTDRDPGLEALQHLLRDALDHL